MNIFRTVIQKGTRIRESMFNCAVPCAYYATKRPPHLNIPSHILTGKTEDSLNPVISNYRSKLHEPPYLDYDLPLTPLYDTLNVQIKGYDFPVLESYGKFIHHTAVKFGLDVEDAWATPCKKMKITRYIPESSNVECEFQLNRYERNVQITDVPSSVLSMFINVIEAGLPCGVTLQVHPHDSEITMDRYVPDFELEDLREELSVMTYVPDKDKAKKK